MKCDTRMAKSQAAFVGNWLGGLLSQNFKGLILQNQ